MKILTAKDIKLMGEPDPTYGQTYYGKVEEQQQPVRFNMKEQVDIMPGRKIYAEEYTLRTSSAGNEYMQLKKVKLKTPEEQAEWIPEEEDIRAVIPQPVAYNEGDSLPLPVPEEVPSYEAGTNARWAIGMAYRAYQQVMGTPEGADGEFPFDVVKTHAQALVRLFNEVKKGD